ncbi:MAG: M48 family metalloprotease [Isosphaeraceae bacterium]|nr:M48 family metalloprotease [Isosphaeraceae bacterium]
MSMFGGRIGRRPEGADRSKSARWVIALVIALFGIFSYFNQTEINPVTGEKQRIAMNVDQEKSLGLEAAPKMAQQMGGAVDPRSDPRARLVAEVGARLVNESDARKSPYADNFHFYLLNDEKTVNAFALPGGQIFITKALYSRLSNEAELAGVLGHEIGHVINRHGAQHMAKGQLGQILLVAVGVGASGEDDGGRKAQMAAMLANQMIQMKYGRDDETESDTYGLRYMAQAGYDPRGMLEVMKVLKEAGNGAGPPEFLSTHPLPETRIQQIQATIETTYPNGIPRDLHKGGPLVGNRLSWR